MSIDEPLIAKHHYARFLAAGRLHFAAHSHHLWPDVSRDAVLACWDDAARLWDDKWERILGPVLAEAQDHVARTLALSRPRDIAFAPNTHEFVVRILSCFEERPKLRVLSTDGEFHSFRRQSRRLVETGAIVLERVATEPFATFEDRFAVALASAKPDLVYLSQVFFDSGFAVKDLGRLCRAAPPDALVVVDGYHAFMALPTDLRAIEDRAFYLAGGYKYAMSGEGACFLHVPAGSRLRPANTGWFADFGALAAAPDEGVAYADDGFRFMGATFDPSGLYRFNAVMRLLDGLGVDVAAIHAHVLALQDAFLAALDGLAHPVLNARTLISERGTEARAHFLTFRHPDAGATSAALARDGVVTDVRGERIRIGFGAYHDAGDVAALLARIRKA